MSSFFIEEWEIWYTFSTYFKSHINNLEIVAKLLVDFEIADCSLMSDGKTFCRTDKGVVCGKTILKLSGNKKQVSIKFESNVTEEEKLTPYAHETWLIGSQFLYGEARQFSQGRELPTPHLRAFLKPIKLIKKEQRITSLYPVILLYQSGILIIEFRIIGSDDSVELSNFISNYVNIYQCDYDYAIVPTAISVIAPEAYQLYSNAQNNLFHRLGIIRRKKKHKQVFQTFSKRIDFGDFEFEMAPIFSEENKETITSVAQTLFTIIGFITKHPISPIGFLLKGVPGLPELGNYWVGRPHIHLVQHSNQLDEASSNENLNKEFFGRILARVPEASGDFSNYVPPNARKFNDYAAYITSAATLWVWSKNGLENQKQWMDINRGNLIYEHQVQAELLEYGFMLHKSLVEKSIKLKRYPDILATRRDLIELKSKMLETTPYGDVRDLLTKGWEQMNLEVVQEQISENLSILESEIKFIESKQGDNFRVFLTVFGLIASASFAKSVVSPLWKAVDLWLPSNENWADLFLVGISAMFVTFLVFFLRRSIYR
jgi:hypothetical protein